MHQRADTTTADEVPLDPLPPRRPRLRRGGPRTPLPLLLLIAVAAGIGIAYVSQEGHATSATYRAATLSARQQQLVVQDQQLGDDLARLESTERIVYSAQQLGMRPAGAWTYVQAKAVVVVPSPQPQGNADTGGDSAVRQLIAALSGSSGVPRGR